MDPVKLLFYTEQYEKANRKIKLTEKFGAIPKKKLITGKFYSKYEGINSINAPDEYIKLIERRYELKPRDIYPYRPPTMNMTYGWFADEIFVKKSNDPRLNFPLTECDVVKTEMRIRQADKNLTQKKFQGKSFKT
ncbi:hypothetical protein HCN44_003660 [Aphidius gifuensis]|uniref:Uncharacterized protein n=1 Tax=Aphidius gifuensis TaxID=684658 RepID=A0A835CL14_APHGI|nr:uncharacterized protein LOC122859675 [Aphidius gifuensis]KAF7987797.1 hypothetical protein HCN44_003660 [Aphidius gifuensis]